MPDQASRARSFTDLHIKGKPVVIYNAWDGGSARAIMKAGAKAIATGDHPVGYAHGYTDDNFDDFSFEAYLATIKEIGVVTADTPFSVDISNAPGLSAEQLGARVRQVLEAGAIGVNFEDRLPDSSGVLPTMEQARRIETIRDAAEQAGVPLHINARTDLFSTADAANHAGLVNEAVERAEAYRQAGANSLFTPLLSDLDLIKDLCARSVLPINIIRISEDVPSSRDLAEAGVARISYGPRPQMEMSQWLIDKAREAFAAV